MQASDETWFDHEKLEVYRESIALVAWLSALLEDTVRAGDIKDQLDRASSSIVLNIAEGNGKYTPKDRCRFFDTAHGSALECEAGLMCWWRSGSFYRSTSGLEKSACSTSSVCLWA